jgi:protocatechuate 3,4-dioxygenase beta subunit
MRVLRTLLVLAIVCLAAARPAVTADQSRPGPPTQTARDGAPATPAVGTAVITGVVVVSGTGAPARRARLTLSSTEPRTTRTVIADEHGRFAFPDLPAARYSLTAAKPGHISSSYGQMRPGLPSTPIQLGDGQKFDARLQITRGGVLTGVVLDEDGDAIPGIQVRALRYVRQNGERTLRADNQASTDDRGVFRIFGLQPGDYVIGATPRNIDLPNPEAMRAQVEAIRERVAALGQPDRPRLLQFASRLDEIQAADAGDAQATGYAPIYYPGTVTMAQAGTVALGPGEERTGLDFQLQRVPVARVEGVIVNGTGQAVQNIQVMLFQAGQGAPGFGRNTTRADSEGRFRFSNVAPGQYRIAARAVPGGGRGRGADGPQFTGPLGRRSLPPRAGDDSVRLWASADVTIDGRDVADIALALQPGVSASGRIVFQGSQLQPPSDLTRLRVSVTPADPGPARELSVAVNGRVDASGKFTIEGISPGRYRLNASGAEGWVLDSAVVDGQNSLDFPFEVKGGQNVGSAVITFTDQRSELSGALTDDRGQPALGYTVLVYPSDQRLRTSDSRRIRTVSPATDGRFTFGTIPPGDYLLTAVMDVEAGSWYDPAFLQQLDPIAVRVTIAEGEKKVQNMRF